MFLQKSPSGALSPYYYKGGYFHGIHYGEYGEDEQALFQMMSEEENYLLATSERRRILMDFYGTKMTKQVLLHIMKQIKQLQPRIIKLAIATDCRSLRRIRRMIKRTKVLEEGQIYLCPDMEEGKTWLVRD